MPESPVDLTIIRNTNRLKDVVVDLRIARPAVCKPESDVFAFRQDAFDIPDGLVRLVDLHTLRQLDINQEIRTVILREKRESQPWNERKRRQRHRQ